MPPSADYTTADELLSAALRGEAPAWPGGEDLPARLVERATLHGVHGLLHVRDLPWPAAVRERIREHAIGQAMWELKHQHLLAQLLAAMGSRGTEPVLIKGSALAYSLYEEPAQRARGDTDVLIAPGERDRAGQALLGLEFVQASAPGDPAAYQASYLREEADGQVHAIDLHWKINNSELLSRLFTHEELRSRAQPLPRLAPHAVGPSEVDALLIACMHRATHRHNPYYVDGTAHHEPDRLVWLYDIHLLAARMDEAHWHECIRLAAAKGLRHAVADGLAHARDALGTRWPAFVDKGLSAPKDAEPPSRYLSAGSLRQHWMDFRALRDGPSRARWLRDRCFPPADYMSRKYPDARLRWLPWLYLRRAAAGLVKRATLPRA